MTVTRRIIDEDSDEVSAQSDLLRGSTTTGPSTSASTNDSRSSSLERNRPAEGQGDAPLEDQGNVLNPPKKPDKDFNKIFKKWFRANFAEIAIVSISLITGLFAAVYVIYLQEVFGDIEIVLPANKQSESKMPSVAPRSASSNLPKIPEIDSKALWRHTLNSGGYKTKVYNPSDIVYKPGGQLLLVIAGHVFDVSGAERMYGEGQGYNGFIGRDCTRGFITGKFDDANCSDDIMDLEDTAIHEIAKWIGFYFKHETYQFFGVVTGLYFDDKGKPTEYMRKFLMKLEKAEKMKKVEAALEEIFPPCNVEWTAATGSRLWCSNRSGGIDRDWVGYPRQFTEQGKETRCACVNPNMLNDPRVSLYKGCATDADSCTLKDVK